MLPSVEPARLGRVRRVMSGHGFERLLDLPAVPAGARSPVHYGRVARSRDGRRAWRLRGLGTDFEMLRPAWVRSGLTRGYSLGWGLGGRIASSTVLLAQAVEDHDDLHDLAGVLAGALGGACLWDVGVFRGRPCLRFAADLGPAWPGVGGGESPGA